MLRLGFCQKKSRSSAATLTNVPPGAKSTPILIDVEPSESDQMPCDSIMPDGPDVEMTSAESPPAITISQLEGAHDQDRDETSVDFVRSSTATVPGEEAAFQPVMGDSSESTGNSEVEEAEDGGSDSESESDGEESCDPVSKSWQQFEEEFRRLERLLKSHQKRLQSKKVLASDSHAPHKLFELEALRRFNEIRHQQRENLKKQKAKIEQAAPRLRALLKKKLRVRTTKPNLFASENVATCLGKGPYYARRLRDAAHYLLRTGEILETHQGCGAHHESLLNHSEIHEGVRRFARGQVPKEKGGFEGAVSL